MDFYTYITREFVIPYYIHFIKTEMACTLLEKGGRFEEQLMEELCNDAYCFVDSDASVIAKLDKIQHDMENRLKSKWGYQLHSQLMLFQNERQQAYDRLFKFLSVFDKIHTLHQIVPAVCPFDTDLAKLKQVCLDRISQVQDKYAPNNKQISRLSSYGFPFLGNKLNVDMKHFTLRLENIFDIVALQRLIVKPSNTDFPSVTLLQGLVLTFDTNESDRNQLSNFDNGSPRKFLADHFHYFLESWRKSSNYETLFPQPFQLNAFEVPKESTDKEDNDTGTYFLSYPMLSSIKLLNCHNFPELLTECANQWLESSESPKLTDFKAKWEFAPIGNNWADNVDLNAYMRVAAFDLIIKGKLVKKNSKREEWLQSSQLLLLRYLGFLDFDVFYLDILSAALRVKHIDVSKIKVNEPLAFVRNWALQTEVHRQYQLGQFDRKFTNASEQERAKQKQAAQQRILQSVFKDYQEYYIPLIDIVRNLFLFQKFDATDLNTLLFASGAEKQFYGFKSLLSSKLNLLGTNSVIKDSALKSSGYVKLLTMPTADFNLKRMDLTLKCLERFKTELKSLKQTDDKIVAIERRLAQKHHIVMDYEDVSVGSFVSVKEMELINKNKKILSFFKGSILDTTKSKGVENEKTDVKQENVIELTPVVLFGLRFSDHFFQSQVNELVIELNQSEYLFNTLELFYFVDFFTEKEIHSLLITGVTDEVLSNAYQAFSFKVDGINNYDLLNEWDVIHPVVDAYIQKQGVLLNTEIRAKTVVNSLMQRQKGKDIKTIKLKDVLFSEIGLV